MQVKSKPCSILYSTTYTHLSVSVVKLTEEADVEADVFYPVTCGDAKATLVWKRFVCPGINVKCVQVSTILKQHLVFTSNLQRHLSDIDVDHQQRE